ncbi:MAG: hypothetical protein JNL79_38680 [Myxococcales bacterium]|nr:hypothetical protein [Myxococcales bacterium]
MCFNAQASFGAAVALTAIGAVSLRRVTRRALLPFAAIPLLFAIQQVSEGMLWRVLVTAPWGRSADPIGRVFLFFALFVWPSYLPLSLWVAEEEPQRARWLGLLTGVGTVVGGYLMACAVLRPSYACIAFGNLYYGVDTDAVLRPLVPFVYVATILAPLLVSSLRGARAIALVALASFSIAGTLFRVGFASVWCFFAAVLSGVVAIVAGLYREVPTARAA